MRTASLPQPSDGMILVIGPRLEGQSVIFLAIQTHLACRFLLAIDSLGLRRNGSSSQFIDPPQDFPKRVPGHGDFGQLERDVATVADDFGPDLDQLLAQARMRPVLDLLRQVQCPLRVCAVVRRRSSVGASPTRQLSLQPEATGAVMEVTKWLKPLV